MLLSRAVTWICSSWRVRPRLRSLWALGLIAAFLLPEGVRAEPQPPAASSGPNRSQSELFERSLQVALEALSLYGPLDDPEALARVAEIGYAIVAASGFTQVPITFYLIDMPEPNAFALPGGQVFLTRGMLQLGLGNDALAALLGHEIAHVVLQHGVRMERRATLFQALTQALVLGVMIHASQSSDGPRPGEVPDPYGIERSGSGKGDLVTGSYAAGLIVSELLLRSYSREFEDEADREGQRWAAQAGFSPEGAKELMQVLGSRLPEPSKEYGYWRTHPFFEERITAARARATELKPGSPRETAEVRERTQKLLLELASKSAARALRTPEDPRRGSRPETALRGHRLTREELLRQAALTAWPRGPEAERLRRDRWQALRENHLSLQPSGRDWGRLGERLDREIAEVASLDPSSALLVELRQERATLESERKEFEARAVEIWRSGVFETGFLERFLSNYPDHPEVPAVALALGEAYGRSGRLAESVERLLQAWNHPAGGEAARTAEAALRRLAPRLEDLVALAELAAQERDLELRDAARQRLAEKAETYTDLSAGRIFLDRYPESPLAPLVTERLYRLAENLYGEIVLYQSIGDSTRAIERIQKILNEAPSSPAARRLLERVVLPG